MNKHGGIKCVSCGSENMKMSADYDGMDEFSVEGEGSGFCVVVSLECVDCGRVYPVCRVKDFCDVSDIVSVLERKNEQKT